MELHAHLQRTVAAGESLKPWLRLGPFYRNVADRDVGRTYLERPASDVGRQTVAEAAAELLRVGAADAREGDPGRFAGQEARWQLVRRPEPFLAWGRNFGQNHLAALLLTTRVKATEAGETGCTLALATRCRALVLLDGSVIFDSEEEGVAEEGAAGSARFTLPLSGEPQTLTLVLVRVARGCRLGFRLSARDRTLEAAVPPHRRAEPALRSRVERAWAAVALDRDLLHPADPVELQLGPESGGGADLRVSLTDAEGEELRFVEPESGAWRLRLAGPGELADGDYGVTCSWRLDDGAILSEKRFTIHHRTPTEPAPGHQRLAERRRRVLEQVAGQGHDPRTIANIWPQVARYALGRPEDVDPAAVREVCAYIDARHDCSDFAIHGLLRLLYWERGETRFAPELTEAMAATVLGFKYWADEPVDTVMWMDSENHRFLFHSAEWLAGQLYPNQTFGNSRQRGLFHATRGRMYVMEWLRQRGCYGFDEWHSNVYYPVNIPGLVNLHDFIIYEDFTLRRLVTGVLDYLIFSIGAHSYRGIFGTSHGRTYTPHLVHPAAEGTAAMSWLLFGYGALKPQLHGLDVVSLATAEYRLPALLGRIGAEQEALVDSKVRQGLPRHRRPPADLRVYRTPDYMLAGLQDYRKGERGPQVHVAQVTMGGGTVVFWSCPETSGTGGGLRPDYWSGNAVLPRCVQHRNVLALHWRLSGDAWLTHCFFEADRFDEVRVDGNWIFARRGDGYLALYSQRGMEPGVHGQYAGRELVCHAPVNTWLVECGRRADWREFDAFVGAVQAAPLTCTDDRLSYGSPSVGRFVSGWDVEPSVDGTTLALHGYPLVENRWARSAFGSGQLTIADEAERLELWFNQ